LIGRVDNVHEVFGKRLTSWQLPRKLLVHHGEDQWQVCQRRKILNQTRRLKDQLYIKLFRFRHPPVRRHHHHFTAVNGHSFFRMTSGIKRADPFQDHKFCGRARSQKSCSPRDRCGNGRCADLDWGFVWRHLQEDRTTRQIEFTRPPLKAENRIRPKARYGEIAKSQFGTRLHAGADPHLLCDCVIHGRRPRCPLSFQQTHLLNYLRDARLLDLCSGPNCGCPNKKQADAKRGDQSTPASLHKRLFHIRSLLWGRGCFRTHDWRSMRRHQRRSRATCCVGLLLADSRHLCAAPKNDQVCIN